MYPSDNDFTGQNQYDVPFLKPGSSIGNSEEDNAKDIENAFLNNVPENDLNYPSVSKKHADKDDDDLNIDSNESKREQHSSKNPSNGLRKLSHFIQSIVQERRDRDGDLEELEEFLTAWSFIHYYQVIDTDLDEFLDEPDEPNEPTQNMPLRYGKRNIDSDLILSENAEDNSDLHSVEQQPEGDFSGDSLSERAIVSEQDVKNTASIKETVDASKADP